MVKLITSSRAFVAFLHDAIMAALSFALALYLRVGEEQFAHHANSYLLEGMLLFAGIVGVAGMVFGLYRGVWRYASLDDMMAIAKTAAVSVLVFFPIMFMYSRLADVPRSLPFINAFVLMALLAAPRIAYRIVRDRQVDQVLTRDRGKQTPVLIYGAGDEAELFLRALVRDRTSPYWAVGIVAQKPGRVGRRIHGVEVFATMADLEAVVSRLARRGRRPRQLILSHHNISGDRMRDLFDAAEANGLTLSRAPRPTELREGVGAPELQPVKVEDLLGRAPVALDRVAMQALIKGRRVMITGAGGSIGAELVRQISDFDPAALTLLDNSEYALYQIDQELWERHQTLDRDSLLVDVRDRRRVDDAFAKTLPEIVFHAAALKHVPLVETNPLEGILTNIVGTRNVAEASRDAGVTAMVLISTDKAVNPTNVMGASKRLAEAWCQALDIARQDDGTRFIAVRFGNVLGSTGSVVPLFQRQLEAGGPLTVTHPDVTRYFMTVGEAVELVLQASALGAGEEGYGGKLFVLDMGEPVRIEDLARQMIRLSGREPDIDVKIAFTGLRPGEKLHEELLHSSENLVETGQESILLASPRAADEKLLARAIDDLEAHCRNGDADAALGALARQVPEFDHNASGVPASEAAPAAKPEVSGAAE
jgi:FlaA1/EpsC-like NDP-sugar epimerase